MRLSTSIVLGCALGSLLASTAYAQGTGRSLDIQPGARQNGMGATGVAIADDATGVTWWNPAGLGFVTKSAVDLTYAQLVPGLASDVNYNYATFVKPTSGWGAFGLGLVFLSYGTSEGTDPFGNPTGTFTSNEVSPALSYGTKLLPDLSVGASLKYIRIQLAPQSQSGVGATFGLDLAALYRIPAARMNFAVNVQNLGPSVTFINEDERSPLSRNVKAGIAWEAYSQEGFRVLVAGDFDQSLVTDAFWQLHSGLELRYSDQIAGRVGYYYDPLGQLEGLTYGIGLGWKGLAIDFGSIPQAKGSGLPNVSKLTLGYRF
jgi:type IX secretion system protein PorV